MTQKEFEDRVHLKVVKGEWPTIETLYMAAGNMDKDTFCDQFRRMCRFDGATDEIEIRPVLVEISNRLGFLEAIKNTYERTARQRNDDLADFLIGKAHAYDDTDFRNQAVKLVGEADVVKRTIELGLPLWDEDRRFVLSMIEIQGK